MSTHRNDAHAVKARSRGARSASRITLALMLTSTLAALVVAIGSPLASAQTAPLIERVWSFNGGEVAIEGRPGGTFVGTVVKATAFAHCTHLIGEEMWTNMTPQADGSYWGGHRWFQSSSSSSQCVPIPRPGPTAWRVIETAGGGHYLLVCFSSPETTQPTIAPNGTAANDTYGCTKSAEVAPVPVVSVQSFSKSVTVPSVMKCYSHRVFKIHLTDPAHDPIKEVVVTIGRHRVAVLRGKKVFVATINLTGLPQGKFTIRIAVTTVLGHHFNGSRTYHTCVSKAATTSKPKRSGSTRSHG